MLIVKNGYGLGNLQDLTTPTSTQSSIYKLGDVVEVVDTDTKAVKKFKYVYSAVAMTKYIPYAINRTGISGAEVVSAAVATATLTEVCVPQVTFTTGIYGFVQTEGTATIKLTGTTGAIAGENLCVLNTGVVFTSGASLNNASASLVTTTTGTTGTAYLYGKLALTS